MADSLEPARTVRGSSAWLVLCRVAALVAVAASTALYVQYLDPADAPFCGLDSGCEAVRRSGFSYFGGSPLLSVPLIGLLAYSSALVASLWMPESLLARGSLWTGGVLGAGLLGVQAFYVGAFCWLCCVVDVAAVLGAVFAYLDTRQPSGARRDPLPIWAWVGLAGLAVSAPSVWVAVRPAAPVPAAIRALYVPGKINVVEFADFECPYCRRLHPVLKSVIRSYGPDEVHFIRKHVPLGGHEQARPAARADICAEQQGKGEALAEKLVDVELSPVAVHRAAIEVGVDGGKLDECLASSEPDRRIDADTKLLNDAGFAGLPTTYVGGKRLLGAVSEVVIRDAFERAKRGAGDAGVPAPLYVVGLLAAVGAVVWLGRSSRGTVGDG